MITKQAVWKQGKKLNAAIINDEFEVQAKAFVNGLAVYERDLNRCL